MTLSAAAKGLAHCILEPALAAAFDQAIAAAEAFRGATAPNPPVGCTVLDAAGQILAVAAHEKAGTPHAEAQALERCRQSGRYDDIDCIVVTLEPCNHWGRTPPCTEAILASPARRIWFGQPDPNGQVAGGGAARLRAAGREVVDLAAFDDAAAAPRAAACGQLIAPFAKRLRTGRPWVTVKQAIDTMGSMIPPPGQKTFTSQAALTLAHQLRRRADALLTGSGTILADLPEFTVRHVPDFPGKRRTLVVLDRRGRVSEAYEKAAAARGLDVMVAHDIPAALNRLGADGALEVLVEAGPTVTNELLGTELWDEHVLIRKSAAPLGAAPEGADTVETRRRGEPAVQRLVLDRV